MISASPRRLSVFKNVVETGGFNAAAARLGIAQPSVCAHVKALESQVGQPLFHRHRGSRPKLTKAGEALYGFALDMLRKSEEASAALAHIRTTEAREITVAVHRDVAASFLPAPLSAFTRKHTATRIVTRIGTFRPEAAPGADEQAHKRFDPQYLREAVKRCQDRLRRPKVEVVLLHNPSASTLSRGRSVRRSRTAVAASATQSRRTGGPGSTTSLVSPPTTRSRRPSLPPLRALRSWNGWRGC